MVLPFFNQGAFAIDPNATPDQIQQKRAYIAAMMPRFGSAKYVGEGLGQLASGVVIGRQNRKLNEAEGAGRKSAADQFGRLFGTANSAQSADVQGPMSVLGMTPEATPAMPPADPNAPGAIAGDAMAALGKPAAHDHGSHPGQSHAEWLKYSNQGATRNDPLDPALVSSMSFLGDMGITMDVVSGGQEPAGTPGGKRTGSTRHDHGKSADVDFYKDGRKLDWNNPNDLPVLQEIVRTAKANGVTGIGAGDDYMGAGRFHIGFGSPAVWGAGGKSANAPAWLVEAYNGAPSGTAPSGSAAPAPTSAPAIPINELYMALQNPWMSAEEKGLITSMIQEQQAASDPMRQLELRKAEIELAQLENPTQQPPEDFATRMFTLNALQIDPQSEEGKVYLMTGNLPEPPEPGYRAVTPEEAAARLPKGADPSEYQVSPEGKIEKIGGGGVTVNNSIDGGGKFEEAFAKGDAATVETVYNSGLAAQRNLGRINQLGALLDANPTGAGAAITQFAGSLGIATEGLDEIQAAQALINSLVPEQRQPGSGPMSDADLALFKQSLPQIINSPGGNKIIVGTMRAIAEYDAEGARIVQRLRSGEITRSQAFDALQNRPNPLEGFKPAAKAEAAPSGTAAPSTSAPDGVEQEVWDALTPEERALWD